jgi:uncharacterized protein YbjQ (UPF0145 family)
VEECLEQGDVVGALATLAELAALAPHAALAEFAGYLTTLAPAIPNYAARRAAGERIGSGGIEKGVDVVVNRRLKGRRGMRWWRARIEGLVAMRVALLNDAWDRLIPPSPFSSDRLFDASAGLDALGNGSALDEYWDLLAATLWEALVRMGREAEGLGATAVVGLCFDSAEVGREMVEVVAYGTAVVLQDF